MLLAMLYKSCNHFIITLSEDTSPISKVVAGCSQCETDQCDGTVGWGGSPDEDGHTTLDALVMEGGRQDTGAVIQVP